MSITSFDTSLKNEGTAPAGSDPIQRACQVLENIAGNRGLTYRCLGMCFTAPDQETVERITTGELIRQLSEATTWLGKDQAGLLLAMQPLQTGAQATLSALEADYGRLFENGVERISPRECSYRWKDAGHITHSEADLRHTLQHQYNNFGIHCDPGFEDHAAVELEFLAFLCEQEAERWASQGSLAARNLRSQQRTFVDDHLARWLPEFCYRLQRQAPHSFYGKMAVFCDQWMSLDHRSGYDPIAGYRWP